MEVGGNAWQGASSAKRNTAYLAAGLANMRPSYKVSFIEDPEQIAFTARRVLRVDDIVANEPGSE